jgi:nucleotide-binding universal stress UspA family protein
MQIRSILCPIDFSDTSRAALHTAACFARQFKAPVAVAFVQDPLLAAAAAQMDLPSGEQEVARFIASTGDDALRDARVLIETDRQVADRIVALAARERADLIVLGAHGLSGIRKAFFGSTTARVLRQSTVPLLIVPPAASADKACDLEGLGAILVLTDFREAAGHAARAAARLAKAIDAPLVLVHVLPDVPMPASWSGRAAGLAQKRLDEAHAAMVRALAPLEAIGPVESMVLQGSIPAVVADVVGRRHAGLIVMGLSAGDGRAQPGAVAYPVICSAAVPVLAIPVEDR